jgi:cellulose synthase/poly-beta-1,6-N-acetylglucosamine synthase-like glycosyltransferase
MHIPSVIISLVILIIYAIYIKRKQRVWSKIEEHKVPHDYTEHCTVSVLIPFRNERLQLGALLSDLEAQIFDSTKVQYLFINDNSTDGSEVLVQNKLAGNPNFKLLNLQNGQGKKAALQLGLDHSSGHLIVTTDADVRIGPQWLRHVVSFYLLQEPLMIIGPVTLKQENTYWKKLVRLEWMSLMALTGASARQNKSLMCNGANLCVDRNTLIHTGAYKGHIQISGGDDMFTLLAFKHQGPNSVKYIWSKEALVETKIPFTLSEFLNQRIRWASKMTIAADGNIKLSGAIILLANVCMAIFFILGVLFPFSYLMYFMLLFGFKVIVDFALINSVAKKMKETISEIEVMALSIIYPFYILIIPIIGLFYKPLWKGREISVKRK